MASLASLGAIALLEIALRLLPHGGSSLSPAAVLDRQGGLEEIERSVIEEMGDSAPDALRANRIYRDDARTLWRLRPNVRIVAKNYLAPRLVRERMPFTLSTNAEGFRGALLPWARSPGALRVAAIGNSSTFGWGVDDGATFSSRLPDALARAGFGGEVEIWNAGIPGFTTFQGERLLVDEVLPLRPDVVILSFGFNDSRRAASTDSAFAARAAQPAARAARIASRLEIYRRLEGAIRGGRGDRLSPTAEERRTVRVPAGEFEARLARMSDAIRSAGARPIFLAMVVPPEYRAAIERVAAASGAPMLDTRPYIFARLSLPEVAAAHAAEFARHEAAWRDVPPTAWKHPAYVDAIHPSPIGHALIAEWIASVIAGGPAPARSPAP